jgi:hypothetical protein
MRGLVDDEHAADRAWLRVDDLGVRERAAREVLDRFDELGRRRTGSLAAADDIELVIVRHSHEDPRIDMGRRAGDDRDDRETVHDSIIASPPAM